MFSAQRDALAYLRRMSRIAGAENEDVGTVRTDFRVEIEFFQKKRMPRVTTRKRQMQRVASVAADDRRLLPIAKGFDMDGALARGTSRPLDENRGPDSKTDENCRTRKPMIG